MSGVAPRTSRAIGGGVRGAHAGDPPPSPFVDKEAVVCSWVRTSHKSEKCPLAGLFFVLRQRVNPLRQVQRRPEIAELRHRQGDLVGLVVARVVLLDRDVIVR